MTHTREMSEYEGEFRASEPTSIECTKCGGPMRAQLWESNCGGYEDYKYTCAQCGRSFWVDGIDS